MPITLEHLTRAALPRVRGGRALAGRERTTLESVIEIFLEGAPADLGAAEAAENVERFLIAGRSRRAWRVRALLTLIELATIPTHGAPFSRLTGDARRTLVRERWTSGRHVHRLCGKVRNLAILGIYGDPRALVATGYVPVPLRPRFRHEPARPPAIDVEGAA